MFRRKDEDENEYLIQPVNKNFNSANNSGFGATSNANNQNQLFGQNISAQPQQKHVQQDEPQTAVPFIKTNSAAVQQEAPKVEAPVKEQQQKIEPKAPSKAVSSANTFIPSAIRATSTPTVNQPVQNSNTSQIPNFSSNSKPLKLDAIGGLETERRLTVGYGISLEGKVSDCDKLVIYGNVHAELNNVKALQISDSGKFRGAAEIDFAEISGVFEGELKVRKNIVINSTGRVSGKITYGSIEIKPGGKFTGEIVEDLALSATAKDENADENQINADYNLFIDQKDETKAA